MLIQNWFAVLCALHQWFISDLQITWKLWKVKLNCPLSYLRRYYSSIWDAYMRVCVYLSILFPKREILHFLFPTPERRKFVSKNACLSNNCILNKYESTYYITEFNILNCFQSRRNLQFVSNWFCILVLILNNLKIYGRQNL